ncbi:capsule biosynthesis protein [Gymnodinialimonas ulvae]|uniref:capsule biosynthesis protein n=1 Tax=Gymnodinialimonas ulvae TaxID=3126504 RepID=UPI0030B6B7DB
MTTKPKARKFRIRRNDGVAPTGETRQAEANDARQDAGQAAASSAAAVTDADYTLPEVTEDGFGDEPMPGSAAYERAARLKASQNSGKAAAQPAAQPATQGGAEAGAADAGAGAVTGAGTGGANGGPQSVEQQLAAIRAEGLTGRQLRMARRLAQKQGLQPSSDFDAVRLLRNRGIDPFNQSSMLELVVDDPGTGGGTAAAGAAGAAAATGNTLPVRAATAKLPSTEVNAPPPPPGAGAALGSEDRAAEIMRVQRDIAARRRRKLVQLAARLACFVLLPTILVSYYFYAVATPLYVTNTEFVIQKAEAPTSGGGGLGSLLGGGGFATTQESITVQSYLESREAMLRLDEELDFRGHFSGDNIDPLTRLSPDATVEQMYDTYLRNLVISYDPTEGLIRMDVLAADPVVSQRFSEALIGYAEERVEEMSARVRADGMAGAQEAFSDAETRAAVAQARVLELQQQLEVVSPEAELNLVFTQISSLEARLTEERLRLAEMNAASRPNAGRVAASEAQIERLEAQVAEMRTALTGGEVSLAQVQSELVVAQADLETRRLMLTEAMQAREAARMQANRQSLYISMGVFPVPPDEAAFPKAFENTLLAFVVFSGIYLLISMTASILREQVSS